MLNADLKEFEFISDFDELVISAVLAVPSGEVNGIVQIVHGMNEHKERSVYGLSCRTGIHYGHTR